MIHTSLRTSKRIFTCTAGRTFSSISSRKLLVTFDAFGTLFTPRYPMYPISLTCLANPRAEIYALIALDYGYTVKPAALKPAFRKGIIRSVRRTNETETSLWNNESITKK